MSCLSVNLKVNKRNIYKVLPELVVPAGILEVATMVAPADVDIPFGWGSLSTLMLTEPVPGTVSTAYDVISKVYSSINGAQQYGHTWHCQRWTRRC